MAGLEVSFTQKKRGLQFWQPSATSISQQSTSPSQVTGTRAPHMSTATTQSMSDFRLMLVIENYAHQELEPEEEWLVSSGTLRDLLAEAGEQAPTEDWERMLDEL
jgi:hypothetical protein